MKTIYIIIFLIVANFNLLANNNSKSEADNLFKNEDYFKAIEMYSELIDEDENSEQLYINRGLCYFGTFQFKKAVKDFTKAIKINPNNLETYKYKANCLMGLFELEEATEIIGELIKKEPNNYKYYNMRAGIFMKLSDKLSACNDYQKAFELGDTNLLTFKTSKCLENILPIETLFFQLPDHENWKLKNNNSDENISTIDIIKNDKNKNDWEDILNIVTVFNVKPRKSELDFMMDMVLKQSKEKAPNAKSTLIDKEEDADYPWIMFKNECPEIKGLEQTESQIYFIILGEATIYICSRSIKSNKFSEDKEKIITEFFKTTNVLKYKN